MLKPLQEEYESQKTHVGLVRNLVISKKKDLFGPDSEKSQKDLNMEILVQYCVLPRLFMSPIDAVFCSQYFVFLHDIDTPRYSIVSYLDKFMKMITPLLFCSTEYEAAFMGHVLNDILTLVNQWVLKPDAFLRESGKNQVEVMKFKSYFSVSKIINHIF